jgi:predicted dehydrogenase
VIDKMKVGVVGCGDVAQNVYLPNLAALAQSGRIELSALADLNLDLARTLAGRFAIPHTFADAEDLLATDVDLVVNLTPSQVHAEVSLKALARGKHVYTEKPIAASLEEADAVVAAAQVGDARMAAAPALLTHPHVQQALRWLFAGVIGKICCVRGRASNPGPDRITDFRADPSWFYRTGAGPLFDLAVYPLQVMTAALGPVRRVTAFSGIALEKREAGFGSAKGKAISVEVDDNTHILLDFGEARFASLDATYCVLSSQGPRMEFYGADGVVNLAATADEPPISLFRVDHHTGLRGWVTPEPLYRGRVNPPRPPEPPPRYTLVNGVEHFLDHLTAGAPLLLTPEHARHVLEIMLAAQESARSGRATTLRTDFDWYHLRTAIA